MFGTVPVTPHTAQHVCFCGGFGFPQFEKWYLVIAAPAPTNPQTGHVNETIFRPLAGFGLLFFLRVSARLAKVSSLNITPARPSPPFVLLRKIPVPKSFLP